MAIVAFSVYALFGKETRVLVELPQAVVEKDRLANVEDLFPAKGSVSKWVLVKDSIQRPMRG
jgi:hypothetical protein